MNEVYIQLNVKPCVCVSGEREGRVTWVFSYKKIMTSFSKNLMLNLNFPSRILVVLLMQNILSLPIKKFTLRKILYLKGIKFVKISIFFSAEDLISYVVFQSMKYMVMCWKVQMGWSNGFLETRTSAKAGDPPPHTHKHTEM